MKKTPEEEKQKIWKQLKIARDEKEKYEKETNKQTYKIKDFTNELIDKIKNPIDNKGYSIYKEAYNKAISRGLTEEQAEAQAQFTANVYMRQQYKENDEPLTIIKHKPMNTNKFKGKTTKELFKLI